MRNARVGALPQPNRLDVNDQNGRSGRGRGGLYQGMTMEDLKEQTAMRLAREQRHQQPQLAAACFQKLGEGTAEMSQSFFPDKPSLEPQPYNSAAAFHNSVNASQNFNHNNQDRAYSHQQPHHISMHHQPRQYQNGSFAVSTSYRTSHSQYAARNRYPDASSIDERSCASERSHDQSGAGYTRGATPISCVESVAPSVSPTPQPWQFQQQQQQPREDDPSELRDDGWDSNRGTPTSSSPMHPQQDQPQIGTQRRRARSRSSSKKKHRQNEACSDDAVPTQELHFEGRPSSQGSSFSTARSLEQPRARKPSHRHAQASSYGGGQPCKASGYSSHQRQPRQDRNAAGMQSKLPHGLTVQELKEMTRARLAAEAAERQEEDTRKEHGQADLSSNLSAATQATSSSGGDSSHQFEHRVRNSQQVFPPYVQHRQNSMESAASAPPRVVHSGAPTPIYRTFSQHGLNDYFRPGTQQPQQQASHHDQLLYPSPLRPIASHTMSQTIGAGDNQTSIDHGGTCQPRALQAKECKQQMDALETSSVASTLASDYLGSESAFSSAISASQPPPMACTHGEDMGSMSFGRSRSYPAAVSIGNVTEEQLYANTPTSTVTTSSSFFDASVGGGPNRRRTATMSPPGLSNLLEDRPLAGTGLDRDHLSIPLFDATTKSQLSVRAHRNEFSPSPTASRGSSPAHSKTGGGGGVIGAKASSDVFQRRPSSTTSVPTVAPSTDSTDDHDGILPLTFGPSTQIKSAGNIAMGGNLPNVVAESVLGSLASSGGQNLINIGEGLGGSMANRESNESSVSAVFRNSAGIDHDITPLSAASGGSFLFPAATSSYSLSHEFGANSWGGSASADIGTGDGNERTTAELAHDLNAILSLSGAGEPSLVCRIDPELRQHHGQNGNEGAAIDGQSMSSLNRASDPVQPVPSACGLSSAATASQTGSSVTSPAVCYCPHSMASAGNNLSMLPNGKAGRRRDEQ